MGVCGTAGARYKQVKQSVSARLQRQAFKAGARAVRMEERHRVPAASTLQGLLKRGYGPENARIGYSGKQFRAIPPRIFITTLNS